MPVTIRDSANERKIKRIAKEKGNVSKHAAVVMAIHDLYERVTNQPKDQTPPPQPGSVTKAQ